MTMAFAAENLYSLTGVTPTTTTTSPNGKTTTRNNNNNNMIATETDNDDAAQVDTSPARTIDYYAGVNHHHHPPSNNVHAQYSRLVTHSSAAAATNTPTTTPSTSASWLQNMQAQTQKQQQVVRHGVCISNNGGIVAEVNVLSSGGSGNSSAPATARPQSLAKPSTNHIDDRAGVELAVPADLYKSDDDSVREGKKLLTTSSINPLAESSKAKVAGLVIEGTSEDTDLSSVKKSSRLSRIWRTAEDRETHVKEKVQEDETYEELEPFLFLQREPQQFQDHIYANLTYIENCYHRQLPVPPARNTPSSAGVARVGGVVDDDLDESEDNIYENICDKCDQIFSGQLCKNCAKHNNSKSGGSSERKKRSFSDFFNSLKRRQKAEKKAVQQPQPRRLEIVHNVDGFAGAPFKANQTFDLQEISALKLIHQQHHKELEERKRINAQQLLQLQAAQVEEDTITRSRSEDQAAAAAEEEEEGEVVLRRKKRQRKVNRRRRSGDDDREPEVIVSKSNSGSGGKREIPTNDDKDIVVVLDDDDDDEDEDAFIATDLNLNSLTYEYEHLVEALASQKRSSSTSVVSKEEVQEEDSLLIISKSNQSKEEAPVIIIPGNPSNDSPEPRTHEATCPTTIVASAVRVTDDDTTTIAPVPGHSCWPTTTTTAAAAAAEQEETSRREQPVLVSQSAENNVCLSVRQWMTSLQFETNDDDDDDRPEVSSAAATTTLASPRGIFGGLGAGGEISSSAATLDLFYVKPIPSRTFEERTYYSSTSSGINRCWRRGLPQRSSFTCREDSAADLNLRIDCFKSEVNKNLAQQQRLSREEDDLWWLRAKSASNSIVITVKDEIRYQEEDHKPEVKNNEDLAKNRFSNYFAEESYINNNCAGGAGGVVQVAVTEHVAVDADNNTRVTHENCICSNNKLYKNKNNNNIAIDNETERNVEKLSLSSSERARACSNQWKVASNEQKNCNQFGFVLKSTTAATAATTTHGDKVPIDAPTEEIFVEVSLSPLIIAVDTNCVGGGGYRRLHRRRNAITEWQRNSLKFQLITRQLLSFSVCVHRTVFSAAIVHYHLPEQQLLLKGVLSGNKKVLRKHKQEFLEQRSRSRTIGELIMGVLSLVESFNKAGGQVVVKPAVLDRPSGQNNLDVVARREGRTKVTTTDRFNINQKTSIGLSDLRQISEVEEEVETETAKMTATTPVESIYQPIWKFHTVGIGRESTSSDTFDGSYNTSDFAEVGDTVEWEIAEEFEFGSSRETLLESSSESSSSSSVGSGGNTSTMSSMKTIGSASTLTLEKNENSEEVKRVSSEKTGENIYEHLIPKWRFSYKPVCILYDLGNAANNVIMYNYDGNRSSAQTKRQINNGNNNVCGGGGGSNNNNPRRSTNCGDKVGPLLKRGSVKIKNNNNLVCESEKLLVAERKNSGSHHVQVDLQPNLHPSAAATHLGNVGYECDEGDTPTQCNNNNNNNIKNCYASDGGSNNTTKKTPTTTTNYAGTAGAGAGANAVMMPPKVYLIPDSVAAWKFMLLDAHYAEDEEDVIMSVPNLLDIAYEDAPVLLETKKLPPLQVPTKDSKLQKTNPLNPRKYVMSGRLNIEDQKTSFLHKSIVGSYKQIEFGSVDNLNMLSKSKSASSILSSSSPTKKSPRFLRFRPSSPRDEAAKQDKQRTVIFGSDLSTLKLDGQEVRVPRFVVECIRLIEEPENIQTNGVYRASGNKNSIEMVKKRMNDRLNLRKDTIWQFLEKQDVHTLTGSLKLFFRGLNTQLIPDYLFDQLPETLGDETSLESIRIVVDELEEVPKATLKFLIKHLTVVTENKAENLMNSSNLSICWGACLFASSATAFDSFESGNIIRKNLFVRVLIDHYHQIFEQ